MDTLKNNYNYFQETTQSLSKINLTIFTLLNGNETQIVGFEYELWQKIFFSVFMFPIIILSIAGNY